MRYAVPAIVGIQYAAQGVYHICKKEWGYALMWLAYAAANAGICLAMMEGNNDG